MSKNIVKPSQDESMEENEKHGKAHWDDASVDAFVKICVDETLAGNRKCGHFSKLGWKIVIKKFNDLTQRTYTFKQLKNKGTALKKEWQIWISLVGKETGLGWDHAKQTIKATDEWWDKKLKENPDAGKFRKNGLRNADQLDILFKDIAVTGECAWASSQGLGAHDVDNDQILGERIDKVMVDGQDDQEYAIEFNNGLENIVETNTFPPNAETTTHDNEKKRKRDYKKPSIGVKVSKQLDALMNAVANRSSTSRNKDKPGCSIEEVMEVVDGMTEIVNDGELFIKAADILTERKNREMFVALKQSDRQIMWLKSKKL